MSLIFSDAVLIEKVFLFGDFNAFEDLSSQKCLFLVSYAERHDDLKTNTAIQRNKYNTTNWLFVVLFLKTSKGICLHLNIHYLTLSENFSFS